MTYELGIVPDELTVDLYRDAQFTSSMALEDGKTWPDSGVQLRFPSDATAWNATISGSVASWLETKEQAATRTHGEAVELWVGDDCWAAGKVARRGA